MTVVNSALQLPKGTSKTFDFTLFDDNGNVLDLTNALITLSVKEQSDDDAVDVLTKVSSDETELKILSPATDGKIQVYLVPSDTTSVTAKQYVYKIDVVISSVTYRPIDYSLFEVRRFGVDYTPPVFTNTVAVDHNYGSPDSMRYMTPGGSPINEAQVRVYYKTDYDAGIKTTPIAVTQTNAYGRWENVVHLFVGNTYVIELSLTNQYGPNKVEITL